MTPGRTDRARAASGTSMRARGSCPDESGSPRQLCAFVEQLPWPVDRRHGARRTCRDRLRAGQRWRGRERARRARRHLPGGALAAHRAQSIGRCAQRGRTGPRALPAGSGSAVRLHLETGDLRYHRGAPCSGAARIRVDQRPRLRVHRQRRNRPTGHQAGDQRALSGAPATGQGHLRVRAGGVPAARPLPSGAVPSARAHGQPSAAVSPRDLEAWRGEGVIEYFPETSDVRPHRAASTAYVLPSYREGMPRTVPEAMSTGRAIITTDAPGCRETVIPGDNGFLVPVSDAAALADAMERPIVEPGLARTYGARSRAIAEEHFDVRRINAEMLRAMGLT